MRHAHRSVALCVLSLLLSACQAPPPPAHEAGDPAPATIGSLRLLGVASVERGGEGALAHFGGISALDRDPRSGDWLLLSDDRSERAPARFYPARIAIDEQGVHDVRIGEPVALLQRDGHPFPGPASGGEVPDPEALRIDPRDGSVVWSSEGDRRRGLQPFVRKASRDGRFAGEFELPPMLAMHPDRDQGVRHNLAIEGLAFAPEGAGLWLAMEAPLFEDGPVPGFDHGALARFTLLDPSGRARAQFAYPVDPIPPAPGRLALADNGVSEVLALASGRLLVVERSGHDVRPGEFRFAVRLYEADPVGASDVLKLASLQAAPVRPMRKRLLLDLATLRLPAGDRVDNIEGAAWGPRLGNGHATLLLVADDNFSPTQKNQFIALEVLP